MWRAVLDLAQPLLMRLGSNGGMVDQDQLEDHVRDISLVHYETKMSVHFISSSDATPAETEVADE